MVLADIVQDLAAARGVETRGGLVEDQHAGAQRDHAGDGDATLLPAGELEGRALEELLVHLGELRRLAHARVDLLLGELHVPRSEGDVAVYRLLKELILRILEHDADLPLDVAAAEFVFVDVPAADEDLAGRGLQQGVEMLDKGGFARAGMSDDPHELPLRDREAYVLYGDFFKGSPRAVYVAQLLHTDL